MSRRERNHTRVQGEGGACRRHRRRNMVNGLSSSTVHPNPITCGRRSEGGAADVFGPGHGKRYAVYRDAVTVVHARSGSDVETDFLEETLPKAGCCAQSDDRPCARSADHKAGGSLKIAAGSVYYLPRPVRLRPRLMQRLDGCIWSFLSPVSSMCEGLRACRGSKICRGM